MFVVSLVTDNKNVVYLRRKNHKMSKNRYEKGTDLIYNHPTMHCR